MHVCVFAIVLYIYIYIIYIYTYLCANWGFTVRLANVF